MPLPLGPDAAALFAALEHPDAERAPRIWVGLSGGLDSSVLAVLAAKRWPDKVHLIHINHHLQTAADDWAAHCRAMANRLSVPIAITDVSVNAQASPENAAREARYQAFCDCIGESDMLLLAHHADDQVETVFYRLLRGAGVDGLSGMPQGRSLGRGQLWRPWLKTPRSALERTARELELTWVEDPSNQQTDADRNFLRQQVLPVIEQRWPRYRESVERARQHVSAAAQRERDHWQRVMLECLGTDHTLDIAAVSALPEADQLSVLREWLLDLTPNQQWLQTLLHEVVKAAPEARPVLQVGNVTVRRFNQRLYRVADLPPLPAHPIALSLGLVLQHGSFGEVGLLEPVKAAEGLPLSADIVARNDLSIRFRVGGERFHPAGRSGSRDLKRLLQEWQVPPWLRDRVPLFYVGERLLAVGHVAAKYGWYTEEILSAPIEPAGILCYRIVPS
ncbi:MAG: tRNA lysidine(34) synthetase TilS [Natronospirillum sp.]